MASSSTTISGGGRSDAPADKIGIGALPNLAKGIGVPVSKLGLCGFKKPSADDGVARLSAELGVLSAESGAVSAELGVLSAGVEANALRGVSAELGAMSAELGIRSAGVEADAMRGVSGAESRERERER